MTKRHFTVYQCLPSRIQFFNRLWNIVWRAKPRPFFPLKSLWWLLVTSPKGKSPLRACLSYYYIRKSLKISDRPHFLCKPFLSQRNSLLCYRAIWPMLCKTKCVYIFDPNNITLALKFLCLVPWLFVPNQRLTPAKRCTNYSLHGPTRRINTPTTT